MANLKEKHLDFIQNVISRMADNSFKVKTWSITIVTALIALAVKDADKSFFLLTYYPAILLWLLDGYFLSQERKFRDLYNLIRTKNENDIDLDMNTKIVDNDKNGFISSVFSKTVFPMHCSIFVSTLIVMFISTGS